MVLAQTGADRVDWETALDADSAIADAWASQQPQTSARSQAGRRPLSAPPTRHDTSIPEPLSSTVATRTLVIRS